MSSCSTHSAPTPSQPLPTLMVNGALLDEQDLANELQYHPNENFENVVQQASQALVIRQLLINEATAQGFMTDNDEEQAIQKLLEKSVSYDDPDEAACLRYFNNNREKFTTVPLIEVNHILLAAAKDDIEGRDAAKSNSKIIIDQLNQDISQFSMLAEQFSACPSKKMGGSLGQISKGQTVPEFERQLMKYSEGLAPIAIESRYGFHVVNITRKIDGKPMEYNMVSEKVKGYLIHRASHLAIQEFIQSLVEKADIQGVEIKFSEENIFMS